MKQIHEHYNPEEAYFYKINKELLERKRKEMDARNNEKSSLSNVPNWMSCPSGELQILLESQEPKGFLGLFRKAF